MIQWLESSFQPKGLGFNPFPHFFFQHIKWMKEYIEHLNNLLKLVAL